MMTPRYWLAVLPLTMGLVSCDAPDPDEYGGGARGAAVAKCISRTERADRAVTREQAGAMCTCLTDKTMGALTGGGRGKASARRELVKCATDAGITITK